MLTRSEATSDHRWPTVPSWALSLGLHALLLLVLGYTLQRAPRGGLEEVGRDVGVVLKKTSDDGQHYFQSAPQDSTSNAAASSSSHALSSNPAQVVGDKSPVDIAAALPSSKPLIGPGASADPNGGSAANMTSGAAASKNFGKAGYTKVPFMGLDGEGSSFVFILDRSASMGNERFSPLQAAKAQLKASLQSLGKVNQFQIVFFNQEPRTFALSGVAVSGPLQKMVFAEPQNVQQAYRFIDGILADGGTEYIPALEAGLAFHPDVIFFLTDAGTPITEAQLRRITDRNRSASLHVIEFGEGPAVGGDPSLARLASANRGRYRYFDITRDLKFPADDNKPGPLP